MSNKPEKASSEQVEINTLDPETTDSKIPLDRSDYIAIIALIVSLVGTVVAVRETSFLQQPKEMLADQQSAGVLPYVDVSVEYGYLHDPTLTYTLQVDNQGVGPAMVTDFQFYYDQRPLRIDTFAQLFNSEGTDLSGSVYTTNDFKEGIIPAGEGEILLRLQFDLSTSFDRIKSFTEKLKLDFCYCNVYQECWRYAPDGWNPRAADCEPPASI
ncbi:MAG: hypothetical protein AAGJ82_02520 [Bacteroidota bacterium]